MAKSYFVEQGIGFEERIVNEKTEWWAEVTALSDTVPVILRDGVVEIGFQGRKG